MMSGQNGIATNMDENVNPVQTPAESKGKGKMTINDPLPHEMSMGSDDDSSDEETGAEDDVCSTQLLAAVSFAEN